MSKVNNSIGINKIWSILPNSQVYGALMEAKLILDLKTENDNE